MNSVPVQGLSTPAQHQPALQLQPAPIPIQVPPAAPLVRQLAVPEDPRGTKRLRESDKLEAEAPAVKRALCSHDEGSMSTEQQALYTAIAKGDLAQVEKAVHQAPQLRHAAFPFADGLTPLCLAAKCGKLDIVTLLLRSGASVDAPASNGSTPLMFAAEAGHAEVVRYLCLLGAKPNAIHPVNGRTPLCWAVSFGQFEASKVLIGFGADVSLSLSLRIKATGARARVSPLLMAIGSDFADLIAWMLDTKKLTVDWIESSTCCTLLTLAITFGSLNVIRLLVTRGAQPDLCVKVVEGGVLRGMWEIAAHHGRCGVVEQLLHMGFTPPPLDRLDSAVKNALAYGAALDVMRHLSLPDDPLLPADGLKNVRQRSNPKTAFESIARMLSAKTTNPGGMAVNHWRVDGWLGIVLSYCRADQNIAISAKLLGERSFKNPADSRSHVATYAQTLAMSVEFISDAICAPDFATAFSGRGMTPQGEQRMNRIAEAQRGLLLKGIADLQAQFSQQVATLPSICMDTYIALSHQLNEADLYRKLTKEWGLFDPIARAVLRLVKDAYAALRKAKPEQLPAEFAGLPQSEQLRYVITQMLDEWDKIPEIAEALLKCSSPEEVELLSDLLFQQWRLFGEAFGVTKPRFSPLGPRQPEPGPAIVLDLSALEECVEDEPISLPAAVQL